MIDQIVCTKTRHDKDLTNRTIWFMKKMRQEYDMTDHTSVVNA